MKAKNKDLIYFIKEFLQEAPIPNISKNLQDNELENLFLQEEKLNEQLIQFFCLKAKNKIENFIESISKMEDESIKLLEVYFKFNTDGDFNIAKSRLVKLIDLETPDNNSLKIAFSDASEYLIEVQKLINSSTFNSNSSKNLTSIFNSLEILLKRIEKEILALNNKVNKFLEFYDLQIDNVFYFNTSKENLELMMTTQIDLSEFKPDVVKQSNIYKGQYLEFEFDNSLNIEKFDSEVFLLLLYIQKCTYLGQGKTNEIRISIEDYAKFSGRTDKKNLKMKLEKAIDQLYRLSISFSNEDGTIKFRVLNRLLEFKNQKYKRDFDLEINQTYLYFLFQGKTNFWGLLPNQVMQKKIANTPKAQIICVYLATLLRTNAKRAQYTLKVKLATLLERCGFETDLDTIKRKTAKRCIYEPLIKALDILEKEKVITYKCQSISIIKEGLAEKIKYQDFIKDSIEVNFIDIPSNSYDKIATKYQKNKEKNIKKQKIS